MKRFRFRLQRLLDIREQIRDEARQELARRNHELAEQQSVLRGLQEESGRLTAHRDGIISAGDLQLTGAYAVRLQQMIERQVLLVAQASQAVVEAQERYVQANKDAKALELLKEKRKGEHKEALLKEEMQQLDEVATQRAGIKE
jgi:flagellar FliJ protein